MQVDKKKIIVTLIIINRDIPKMTHLVVILLQTIYQPWTLSWLSQ